MDDLTLPLEPNQVYHIFNRGNNRQQIFFADKNYWFFLKRYAEYLQDYFDTFAYCLLPNHFHLMVRVKTSESIVIHLDRDFKTIPTHVLKKIGIQEERSLVSFQAMQVSSAYEQLDELQQHTFICWVVSERIRRFLMSYAKAINIQENRTGSLLQKTFRRKRVADEGYFTQLIGYIHRNAIHHGLTDDFMKYPWSSYRTFLSTQPTKIRRAEVLRWFGGKQEFIKFHDNVLDDFEERSFWME